MTTPQHDEEQTRLSTADMARAATPQSEPTRQSAATQQTTAVADADPVERHAADRSGERSDNSPLFAGPDATQFRERWVDIQASFVDDPRRAVEQADTLVAEVMQRLAQAFADERKTLEQQWDRGGDTETEELRLALRRYRSFFGRLLAL